MNTVVCSTTDLKQVVKNNDTTPRDQCASRDSMIESNSSTPNSHKSTALSSSLDLQGYLRYPCPVCGKKFAYKARRTSHMRAHTQERPYKCKFCGLGFTFTSARKCHERLHTGEQPYVCQVCSRTFTQIGTMQSHQRKHHPQQAVMIGPQKLRKNGPPPGAKQEFLQRSKLNGAADKFLDLLKQLEPAKRKAALANSKLNPLKRRKSVIQSTAIVSTNDNLPSEQVKKSVDIESIFDQVINPATVESPPVAQKTLGPISIELPPQQPINMSLLMTPISAPSTESTPDSHNVSEIPPEIPRPSVIWQVTSIRNQFGDIHAQVVNVTNDQQQFHGILASDKKVASLCNIPQTDEPPFSIAKGHPGNNSCAVDSSLRPREKPIEKRRKQAKPRSRTNISANRLLTDSISPPAMTIANPIMVKEVPSKPPPPFQYTPTIENRCTRSPIKLIPDLAILSPTDQTQTTGGAKNENDPKSTTGSDSKPESMVSSTQSARNAAGKFVCDICGRHLKHASTLKSHKLAHTGEKPFECKMCGNRYRQGGHLKDHIMRTHWDQVDPEHRAMWSVRAKIEVAEPSLEPLITEEIRPTELEVAITRKEMVKQRVRDLCWRRLTTPIFPEQQQND